MKNKVIGVLITLMMFFSIKGLVSAKTIDVNDFQNEINKFNQYGVSASIDSKNNQININFGSPLMVASYNDDYIEYNGRNHNGEYYSAHPNEMQQRSYLTTAIVETIKNLYGVDDNYEQYGIQLEEEDITAAAADGVYIWSEITYFKLPLNTDNANNGTTSDENSEVNDETTSDENSEVNDGTTSDENSEANDETTSDENSEANDETTGDENSEANDETTGDENSEVNNGTTSDENSEVNNETTNDKNINSNLVNNKTPHNPNTGDNILIYFGAFIILIMASIFTIRKVIMNK